MSEGKKFDEGKAPIVAGCFQYFPLALKAVAEVSSYGLKKYNLEYEDQNWSKVDKGYARYSDALGRHLLKVDGEVDTESGLYHDAMAAWNALARLELKLREAK